MDLVLLKIITATEQEENLYQEENSYSNVSSRVINIGVGDRRKHYPNASRVCSTVVLAKTRRNGLDSYSSSLLNFISLFFFRNVKLTSRSRLRPDKLFHIPCNVLLLLSLDRKALMFSPNC